MKVEFLELPAGGFELPTSVREAQPVLVLMPYTDRAAAERSARQLAARAGTPGLLLAAHDAARHGFVAVANKVFRATGSEFFAYVAQDCYAGRGWLWSYPYRTL